MMRNSSLAFFDSSKNDAWNRCQRASIWELITLLTPLNYRQSSLIVSWFERHQKLCQYRSEKTSKDVRGMPKALLLTHSFHRYTILNGTLFEVAITSS